MATKKVTITLDEELIKELEQECKIVKTNKSAYIAQSIRKNILERKEIENMKQNKDIYAKLILDIAESLKDN